MKYDGTLHQICELCRSLEVFVDWMNLGSSFTPLCHRRSEGAVLYCIVLKTLHVLIETDLFDSVNLIQPF